MSSKSGIIGISKRNQPIEIIDSATENVVVNVIFSVLLEVYKPNVYDSRLGQTSCRRFTYVHICGVYFVAVKMKILTSLNIYLESESPIGNTQHLNLNSRKMLFCMTVKRVELSVTSTVHLFYFRY